MTKVIENIELLKKLAPYIDGWGTDYNMMYHKDTDWQVVRRECYLTSQWLKTLTLEEAIELFPECIAEDYHIFRMSDNSWWWIKFSFWDIFIWKTLLEAVEKMLEYLIDNDLLWKQ